MDKALADVLTPEWIEAAYNAAVEGWVDTETIGESKMEDVIDRLEGYHPEVVFPTRWDDPALVALMRGLRRLHRD